MIMNCLRGLASNVNESDLIMTDYTYTSKSIQSFSLKNVTANPYPSSPLEVERAKDNVIAWDRPSLLRSFLRTYEVKYILLDSELGHRIPPEIGGMIDMILEYSVQTSISKYLAICHF